MAMMYAFYRFWLCVLWIAPSLWTRVASQSEGSFTTTVHQWTPTVTTKSMITPSLHNSSSVSLDSASISPSKTSKMSSHSITLSPNKTSPISSYNITATTSHTVTLSFNTTVVPSGSVTMTPSQNRTVMPIYNTTVMPLNTTVVPSGSVTMTPSQNGTVMPIYNTTVMPFTHNMTIMPSSAHSVVLTSTVHPMPPAPERGNFSVTYNHTVCLVAYMAASFDVEVKSKRKTILLPTNASASGECDENGHKPNITLAWNSKEGSCKFTMHFQKFVEKGEDFQRWAAANLTFSLMTADGSIEAVHYTFSSWGLLKQLSAKVGHSYECTTSTTNLKLIAVNSSSANVSLEKIEFQPFDVHNGKLGEAEKCGTHPMPTTPSTKKPQTTSKSHAAAIAVGCSLAGLVVIVVIGYLIGRRRSRNVAAGYRKL